MSQYELKQRQRQQPRQWWEVLWDVVKGVFIQVLFTIIDGVVYRIKEEVSKALGYNGDWRSEYR